MISHEFLSFSYGFLIKNMLIFTTVSEISRLRTLIASQSPDPEDPRAPIAARFERQSEVNEIQSKDWGQKKERNLKKKQTKDVQKERRSGRSRSSGREQE